MRSIRILVALIVLCAAGAAAFVLSGSYDVAAASPEPAWRARIFTELKDRAIDRRASELGAPPPLADEALVRSGLAHFNEMCIGCHGAPGIPRSEIGVGLNPPAPDLAGEVQEATPGRLFWVVKNGIRMTGMPAFGPTHTDAQIWAMVAFLEQLPKLDAQRYGAMLKELATERAEEAEHGAAPPPPQQPPH
jgi:mono/diheme cytochrome c family protein